MQTSYGKRVSGMFDEEQGGHRNMSSVSKGEKVGADIREVTKGHIG